MKIFRNHLIFYVILAIVTGFYGMIIGHLEFKEGGVILQPLILFGGALVFVLGGAFILAWLDEKNRNQMRKN